MLKKILLVILLSATSFLSVQAQVLAELEVNFTEQKISNVPVSVSLDAITFLPGSELTLLEESSGSSIEVPYQIENKGERILHWLIVPRKAAQTRRFKLVNRPPGTSGEKVELVKQNGSLVIKDNQTKFLSYQFGMHYPPKGVDTAFKRSGFIHPLWTPNGQELTRINAPDHYHHYGLWNPWTKILFEGESLDFWNLKDRKGTVRFADFLSLTKGKVYAEFQVLHEHVAFRERGEKTALNEVQTIRVYPMDQKDYYLIDLTFQLNCASESPVLLQEYRYGGLGWRATESWHKDNSEILTSEGKKRREADGSNARWAIVQGTLGEDYGGAVMLSYPGNYNHPEPLRVWPEDANGRGDVFANFSPTKDRDWELKPGEDYVLKYRFVVFNNQKSKEFAEDAWRNFANPPQVRVKLIE